MATVEKNTKNEKEPPPEYHNPDEDQISPACKKTPATYSQEITLVPYQPLSTVQSIIVKFNHKNNRAG